MKKDIEKVKYKVTHFDKEGILKLNGKDMTFLEAITLRDKLNDSAKLKSILSTEIDIASRTHKRLVSKFLL